MPGNNRIEYRKKILHRNKMLIHSITLFKGKVIIHLLKKHKRHLKKMKIVQNAQNPAGAILLVYQ